MTQEPFRAFLAASHRQQATELIRQFMKLSRLIWRHTMTGVHLYAHQMTGVTPDHPAPELSPDERLWLLELKDS